jgi:hypothetical protein
MLGYISLVIRVIHVGYKLSAVQGNPMHVFEFKIADSIYIGCTRQTSVERYTHCRSLGYVGSIVQHAS